MPDFDQRRTVKIAATTFCNFSSSAMQWMSRTYLVSVSRQDSRFASMKWNGGGRRPHRADEWIHCKRRDTPRDEHKQQRQQRRSIESSLIKFNYLCQPIKLSAPVSFAGWLPCLIHRLIFWWWIGSPVIDLRQRQSSSLLGSLGLSLSLGIEGWWTRT